LRQQLLPTGGSKGGNKTSFEDAQSGNKGGGRSTGKDGRMELPWWVSRKRIKRSSYGEKYQGAARSGVEETVGQTKKRVGGTSHEGKKLKGDRRGKKEGLESAIREKTTMLEHQKDPFGRGGTGGVQFPPQ